MKREKIFATPHEQGMAIYVTKGSQTHYVMTHRKNTDLFYFLRNGRSLGYVRGYKPSRHHVQQRLRKSLDHILRVTDYVLTECAA